MHLSDPTTWHKGKRYLNKTQKKKEENERKTAGWP